MHVALPVALRVGGGPGRRLNFLTPIAFLKLQQRVWRRCFFCLVESFALMRWSLERAGDDGGEGSGHALLFQCLQRRH